MPRLLYLIADLVCTKQRPIIVQTCLQRSRQRFRIELVVNTLFISNESIVTLKTGLDEPQLQVEWSVMFL